MTQQTLENIIIKLKCCSAKLANEIITNLNKGGCDNSTQLILLNDYIKQLSMYTLDDETQNCLTSDEFDNIIVQSKNICDLCDCGTH
jgi:hypothetical protein